MCRIGSIQRRGRSSAEPRRCSELRSATPRRRFAAGTDPASLVATEHHSAFDRLAGSMGSEAGGEKMPPNPRAAGYHGLALGRHTALKPRIFSMLRFILPLIALLALALFGSAGKAAEPPKP